MQLGSIFRIDRLDLKKNSKFLFYLNGILNYLTPSILFQQSLNKKLAQAKDDEYILNRVNYYNKLEEKFSITDKAVSIHEFKKEKKKTYFFDLLEYLKYFNNKFKVEYLFGDIIHVPDSPSFVKSRPIDGDNANSVLMKLNKTRHFIFIDDKIAYRDKKDMVVWRGKGNKKSRQLFLQKFFNNPKFNIGQINKKEKFFKDRMTLENHLEYKFLVSLEGNDVATNLKWAMSSNSLVLMPKPKYETWFMEGTLIAGYHYVLIEDDFSNLEEQIAYYSENIEEALQIIKNANDYIIPFKDEKMENLISLCVVDKYFKLSSQS